MKAVFKVLRIAGAAAFVALAVWLWHARWQRYSDNIPPPESFADKLARWRTTAQPKMLKDATNDIFGFQRLIDSSVDTTGDDLRSWTGTVTADYVNQAGGVDRTNGQYSFVDLTGELVVGRVDPALPSPAQ